MQLGEKMEMVGLAIYGQVSFHHATLLVDKIVDVLKMNKAHKATYYKYPVEGLGGQGFTYIQPITESFIAFDAWPDHNGAYLVICSCKPVDIKKVNKVVGKEGYIVKNSFNTEMGLK